MGNPKRLARAPGSVVEQLLQAATEQRVLAQRGDDRLLKGISSRALLAFLCLARPSPHSSRAMINGKEIVGPGDVCRVVTARVLLW
jgi:hypothetical protein